MRLPSFDPRIRTGDEERLAFLDWTIDGVPLRKTFGDGEEDTNSTLLYEDADPTDRLENLRRLREFDTPPPTFEPRYHRTWFDRLVRLRGTPIAPWGTAFSDGRVCLLYCFCGDLDCPTLSTQVVTHADKVEWREIGWQVTYEPFESNQSELVNAVFERKAYETLIDNLLQGDWSLPDSTGPFTG